MYYIHCMLHRSLITGELSVICGWKKRKKKTSECYIKVKIISGSQPIYHTFSRNKALHVLS